MALEVEVVLKGSAELPPCDEAARANQRLDDLVVADPVEPEVAQAELDALAALVDANKAKASADIVALSDLVKSLDGADRAEDNAIEAADKVEDDQQNAALVDLANRVGSGPAAANPGNDILLDSFAGSDDAKLDQALTVAQASNPKRAIRLAARAHTFTKTRTTFSGLRILGPAVGWQNPEIAGTGGALPQCVVNLNVGIGTASWLVGTSTTYNVTVAGITFKSATSGQFYHHPYSAGTSYATRLDTLSFYGFRYVLGTPTDPFSMTLCTMAGEWTCVAVQGEQFSLRGSDNWLTPDSLNYGWQGANGGRYLARFSNLSKSTVKHWYLTARGGSRAILVEGPASSQGGLDFSDCVVEGQNLNDPAMGALIVVKGGGASFTNTRLNFGMARPSDYTDQADTALVMVQGGVCLLTNTWTGKANAPGTSTPVGAPLLEVSGGVAHVERAFGVQPIGTPVQVRRTGGTLVADSSVTVL